MQRYFSKELKDGYFTLEDSDLYHIRVVMRMKDQDKIEVVYQEKMYLSCIENVNGMYKIKQLEMVLESTQKIPEVVLCIPVLKEQKMDFIIQKATELGVHKIIPLKLSRSVVKLDESKEQKKIERWNKIAKEASEQSKRVTIPEITGVMNISKLQNLEGLKLVCSTSCVNYNLHNLC